MNIKALKAFTTPNGHRVKKGDTIDIAMRAARKLIAEGKASSAEIPVAEVHNYTKDNPPPPKEEVELPEDIIPEPPAEQEEKKPKMWDKLKSKWPAQE